MEAVYTLFNVDRGVPEVFDSVFDIRQELRALYYLSDKKTLPEMDLPVPKLAAKTALRKLKEPGSKKFSKSSICLTD